MADDLPKKKNKDGTPKEPTEPQLNSIRNDPVQVAEIRSRLSDISWWMRLMCQTIAQRINAEDQASGKVWENRFKAVRLLDESALLACSAYVDLNPIRAAMAEMLEQSDYTSIQRRIQALKQQIEDECLNPGSTTIEPQHVNNTSPSPGPNSADTERLTNAPTASASTDAKRKERYRKFEIEA